MTTKGPRVLWQLADIAAAAGVSRQAAQQWQQAGRLPPAAARTPRGSLLWDPATIERWLAETGRRS